MKVSVFCENFRIFSLAIMGLVFTFCCFVVVGYQSLLPILLNEGLFFHSECGGKKISYQVINHHNTSYCENQIVEINGILPTSVTSLNLFVIVNGFIIDFFVGPKIFSVFAGIVFIAGCVMMSLINVKSLDWLVYPAYIITGVGGNMIIMCYIHISNALHPRIRSFYSTIIMSSYDTSAVVFLVFYGLYFYQGASYRLLFLLFCIVPTCHSLLSLFFQPCSAYKSRKPIEVENQTSTSGELQQLLTVKLESSDSQSTETMIKKESEKNISNLSVDAIISDKIITSKIDRENSYIYQEQQKKVEKQLNRSKIRKKLESFCKNFKNKSFVFLKQIKKVKFWVSLPFFAMTTTSSYFYMATLRDQLMWISNHQHEDKVNKMTEIFGILLIFLGFLSSIVSGGIMYFFGTPGGLVYCAFVSVIQTVLSVIQDLDTQYATMVFYVLLRGSIFGVLLYFDVEYFGELLNTILGIQLVFASLVNLTNNIWVDVAVDNFMIFNIMFGTLYVLSAGLLFLVLVLEKIDNKKKIAAWMGETLRLKERIVDGFKDSEVERIFQI